MTDLEKFMYHAEEVAKLCKRNNWGDAFSYARGKEILAAGVLGHQVAQTLAGPDAFLPDGSPVEYKSTTAKNVRGSYTGISVQPTWTEQEKYLKEEKIANYPEHYYNRFEDMALVESWMVYGDVVYDITLPKFKAKYPTVLKKKDPRLSAQMSTGDIRKYGTRVI